MSARRVTTALVASLLPELSDRDVAVVQTVAALKFVKATQLERLYFSNLSLSSRARRRRDVLRRLSRLQLITPLDRRIGGVRAGSAGLVFALGPAGQRLIQILNNNTDRLRRPVEPSLQFVDHTLAVAETYTQVYESGVEVLAIQTEPNCWRMIFTGLTNEILKPDLFVELGDSELIYSWFIEVDRGTERRPALRRKAERYLAAYRHGLGNDDADEIFPRVLWLVPDRARRQFVEEALSIHGMVQGLMTVIIAPMTPEELFQRLRSAA